MEGIRVADASVFPTMPAVNPMIGVLMVGEKAAELIRDDERSATTTAPGGVA
jgi:choline dehydrogenase-like flavoprotein